MKEGVYLMSNQTPTSLKDMIPVLTRIVLRYVSGGLVAMGALAPEYAQVLSMDPELTLVVGLAIGGLTEWAYAKARQNGWAK
jgi:hypothetical protein